MLRGLMIAMLAAATPAAAAAPADDPIVARAKSVMMTDPAAALMLARRAERSAQGQGAAMAAAKAEWLQGEALSRLDRPAEAMPVLERALATVVHDAPAASLHGDILLSRGWVGETSGAIGQALRDFQQAFLLYRAAGEARGQAKALQYIAGIYQDAGDNERTLRYYSQAAEVYRGDPAFSIAAYNNVGETLRVLGRYGAAEAQYRLALAAAQKAGSPLLQANILTNLAATLLARGDARGAAALAQRALALSARREAADERPFVWGVLAQIAMRRGDVAGAASLIERTFAGVDLDHSSLAYRDFHKLAADIYARQHSADLAFAHLRAFKRLDDGVREVATSTNAALMAAQFDFSNQNLRIAQLQANRARLHETVLVIVAIAVSIVSGLLLIGLVSLRRSRDRVRAANGQLGEANNNLQQALKAKSDFLAMTSHEIRTPLNGILGMTQVMLADRQVAGPLRTRVEIVHSAGETMRALVDDILDLSKMETGKLVVSRGPVALPQLLSAAASLWRDKAEAKGLDLQLDLGDCPPLIEEDEDRLRQILFNLLSNAVKFTERGMVALRAGVVHGDGGERLRIVVADSGIGIPPEQHALIFEKFQQADASTARRYGGTGLGLAICRNLADALGGSIALDSRAGAGATFAILLPLRRLEAPAAPVQIASDGPRPLAQAAILLLEPNPLTQRMIGKSLAGAIGSFTAVGDAAAVLEALAGQRFDHVVLQAGAAAMPGVTLESALARLVAAATARDARTVILFAGADGVDEAALLASGAAAALQKPVAGEALVRALRIAAGEEAEPDDVPRRLVPAA